MFTTIIVKPLFNLLVLIYGLIPGHNFGLAIILFTVLIRLLMWPLIKKQLHQAKLMRQLQPELKRIKKASGGNRQQESALLMELYKERGINPFSSIGLLLVQLPIFIGLYSGLHRIIDNPQAIVDFSYSWVHNLGWIQSLAQDIHRFDSSLFGIFDFSKNALPKAGGIYWPAMIIVLGSALMQYFQSKQLMPSPSEKRSLRKILSEASAGKKADQSEVNAAVGRSTRFLLPAMIFLITVNLASALSLYWLTSGLVAFIQQARILGKDEQEMEKIADAPIEGEVVSKKTTPTKKKKSKKSSAKKRKKR